MANPTLSGYAVNGQSYLPDQAESDTPEKLLLNYNTHLLAALNESASTDGFIVTGISSGKLYVLGASGYVEIRSGTGTDVPGSYYYVDFTGLSSASDAQMNGTAVPGTITHDNILSIRSNGVFIGDTRISASTQGNVYWESATPDTAGMQNAFTVRAVNREGTLWTDWNETYSSGSATVQIEVLSINDAPIITLSGSDEFSTDLTNDEDDGTTLISGFAFDDGDTGVTQNLTVTAVAYDDPETEADESEIFTSVSISSGVLSYTLAENANGTGIIRLQVQDDGGVVQLQDDDTTYVDFHVTVNPVNDAPELVVPEADQTAGLTGLTFGVGTENAITVSDIDYAEGGVTNVASGLGVMSVTLNAGEGAVIDLDDDLAFQSAYSGMYQITGDGTNSVTIVGTAEAINDALDGMTYSGLSDDTLNVLVDDLGNNGGGNEVVSGQVNISVPPMIEDVSFPDGLWVDSEETIEGDGIYSVGDELHFSVTYNMDVTVSGSPRLALNIGGNTEYAEFVSESSGVLNFSYTVASGDNDGDGITLNSYAIDLNGGTIRSNSGANAQLTLSGFLSGTDLEDVLIDTVAPATPSAPNLDNADDSGSSDTDQYTNIASGVTFAGTAEAGSTLLVAISGTEYSEEVEVNASGQWTVTFDDLSALDDGAYTVTAEASDLAGNTSAQSSSVWTLDREAPGAVSGLDLSSADDSAGASNTDNITNVTELVTFTGIADPHASVRIWIDSNDNGEYDLGEPTSTTLATSGGYFESNLNFEADGEYQIKAAQEDLAGNLSEVVASTTVVIDTQVDTPDAPDLIASRDSIASSNASDEDDITNNVDLTFTGMAEANADVTMWIDSDENGLIGSGEVVVTGVADASGVYELTFSGLEHSTDPYLFRVQFEDEAGNVSDASDITGVFVDTVSPGDGSGMVSSIALDSADDTGSDSGDGITNVSSGLTFTGVAPYGGDEENQTTVYLWDTNGEDDDLLIGSGVVDVSGNFSFDVDLAEGDYTLYATAEDVAGNSTSATATFDISVDLTPPPDASGIDLFASDDLGWYSDDNITSVNSGLTFSGYADDENTVNVYRSLWDSETEEWGEAVQIESGISSISGVYNFDDEDSLIDGLYRYSAYQVDLAGNESANADNIEVTVDTQGANVSYDAVNFEYYNDTYGGPVLTIKGDGFLGLLNAGESAEDDISDRVGLSGLSLNLNAGYDDAHYGMYNDGFEDGWGYYFQDGDDYFLSADDIESVFVEDDGTLRVVLSSTPNVEDLMDDEQFGYLGYDYQGDYWSYYGYYYSYEADNYRDIYGYYYGNEDYSAGPDEISFDVSFVGTDLAGNTNNGSASGIGLTGEQNFDSNADDDYDSYWSQVEHSFTLDLENMGGATDDTFGVETDTIDADDYPIGEIYVQGQSAAELSVAEYYGEDGYGYYLGDNSFDLEGSLNYVFIATNGEDGEDIINNHIEFADGSIYYRNFGEDHATLYGDRGADQLVAGEDGDRLIGNRGDDLLIGGKGGDALYGGTGADVMVGNVGNDYFVGGSGSDTYVFTLESTGNFYEVAFGEDGEGHDVIADFAAGTNGDVIHFGDVDWMQAYDWWYNDVQPTGPENTYIIDSDDGEDAYGYDNDSLGYASAEDFIDDLLATLEDGPNEYGFGIQQSGADTLITFNEFESVRLLGVNASMLTAANFAVGSVDLPLFNGTVTDHFNYIS